MLAILLPCKYFDSYVYVPSLVGSVSVYYVYALVWLKQVIGEMCDLSDFVVRQHKTP